MEESKSMTPYDARRLAEIKKRGKLGTLNADERWLLSRIDSLSSEVARLTAELEGATATLKPLDAVCDVLGIQDSDDAPADVVKQWIVRAEAAETELRALRTGAKP